MRCGLAEDAPAVCVDGDADCPGKVEMLLLFFNGKTQHFLQILAGFCISFPE